MTTDPLGATFAALSDPTRREILARLAQGEVSVTELARPFRMTLPAVSKHLRVLQRAGLIEQGRQAQWRPCRLRAGPLKDAADWIETYRRHWEESFDRLDEYISELRQRGPVQRPGRPGPASTGPGIRVSSPSRSSGGGYGERPKARRTASRRSVAGGRAGT